MAGMKLIALAVAAMQVIVPAHHRHHYAHPVKHYARVQMAKIDHVKSTSQFDCLDKLWVRESGWNKYAENPSSGAYGIPQSLPGSKMASAGKDWRTDAWTQVRWGLRYIRSRYSTPCGAWSHETGYGWYIASK